MLDHEVVSLSDRPCFLVLFFDFLVFPLRGFSFCAFSPLLQGFYGFGGEKSLFFLRSLLAFYQENKERKDRDGQRVLLKQERLYKGL